MHCFPCFRSQKSMKSNGNKDHGNNPSGDHMVAPDPKKAKGNEMEVVNPVENRDNQAKTFTFRELATATKNFRQECLIGEGGSGRVYKGTLTSTGQVVAVKQLDRHGFQGGKDFHSEVSSLSLFRHENLVNLIGYCADGDQRVLVYEFMSGGTLQDHLLDRTPEKKPLDWFARMKIAFGAAKGLEYLHDQAKPPIIFRDLKPSNILLTEDLNAKLSDYGLERLSPSGDNSPISSRMMGTYGYAAPEYSRSGHLTMKSVVYSFGVVFLEILTGRRAMDTTRPIEEQNLVAWATPMFRDPKRFPDLADPLLEMRFPEKDLNQAVAIAAMCLQEEPGARPLISDVVVALSFLSVTKEIVMPNPPPPAATPAIEERAADNDHQKNEPELSSSDDEEDSGSSEDEDASDQKNSEGQESVDDKSEVNESDYQYSNSYSKRQVSSLRKSTKKRGSTKHVSSSRSAARKTSQVSRDGSISSSETSSRSSQDEDPLLSQKSSKVSRHALSHKSSRGSDDRTFSSSGRGSRSRDPSMSRGSSINSRDGIGSMSHKSSRKSRTKSKRHHDDSSSDHGSEDGGLSSIHGSSRGSNDEGFNHLDHSNSNLFEL